VAERLHDVLLRLFGREAPVRIRAWDGSEAGPTDAPVILVHSRRALRRMLWRPDELGLARAYVAGEIDIEGDLFSALKRLAPFGRYIGRRPDLTAADRRELLRTAVLLGAVGPAPKPPPEESARPSAGRDRAVISHHYDVGNEFYSYVLGPSLVFSSAYWADPSFDLESAQRAKLDLVCRKLGLTAGMRLLDVGCGFGSLLLHAASEYGVSGVGITVSAEQAELARKRIAEADLSDLLEIRLADWREIDDGPYDAIASLGLTEHVGAEHLGSYASSMSSLLRGGGRLLNHQIARSAESSAPVRSFVDAYAAPEGDLVPLGTIISALEEASFEVRDVESLREHYGRTLRAWVANLEAHWADCVEQTSPGRVRAWHLYMAASALAFEAARISVHQVLAVCPHADGRSDVPLTRRDWAF
jgi:cyclopropane-fatty-acyl-phospholipid synthase